MEFTQITPTVYGGILEAMPSNIPWIHLYLALILMCILMSYILLRSVISGILIGIIVMNLVSVGIAFFLTQTQPLSITFWVWLISMIPFSIALYFGAYRDRPKNKKVEGEK